MLREQINADIIAAMKQKQQDRVRALRLINAAIKDRDISVRTQGRDEISEEEIMELLQKMCKQRRDSAAIYAQAGAQERAKIEQFELELIESYLPKAMDEAETQAAIDEIIARIGASTMADMGKVMSLLKTEFSGQLDMALAGPLVKRALS